MTSPRAEGGSPALTGKPSPLRMLWITAALAACFLGIKWGLRDAPLLWFAGPSGFRVRSWGSPVMR